MSKGKVYVAAMASQRLYEAAAAATALRKAGYEVTSRWLNGLAADTGMTEQAAALMDLEDVRAGDYLMLLTRPMGANYSGGGRMVEFGYALALGKNMIVVGDFEMLFCHLPNVRVFPTVEAAIHFMELD